MEEISNNNCSSSVEKNIDSEEIKRLKAIAEKDGSPDAYGYLYQVVPNDWDVYMHYHNVYPSCRLFDKEHKQYFYKGLSLLKQQVTSKKELESILIGILSHTYGETSRYRCKEWLDRDTFYPEKDTIVYLGRNYQSWKKEGIPCAQKLKQAFVSVFGEEYGHLVDDYDIVIKKLDENFGEKFNKALDEFMKVHPEVCKELDDMKEEDKRAKKYKRWAIIMAVCGITIFIAGFICCIHSDSLWPYALIATGSLILFLGPMCLYFKMF